MTTITFDVAVFRAQTPAFASESTYPDETLQAFWDAAICYIDDSDYGDLAGDCRRRAINLMTAHLIITSQNAQNGEDNEVIVSARIHNVSISVRPPPSTTQWGWWLNTTPYGQQLRALLSVRSVGGWYIGGRSERSGFRKINGEF